MNTHEVEFHGGPIDGDRRAVRDDRAVVSIAQPLMPPAAYVNAEASIPIAEAHTIEHFYRRDAVIANRFNYEGDVKR